MDKFGLIGFPIGHSLSPALFSAAYGGRYQYELIERESFEECLAEVRTGKFGAVNVTAPFKAQAAMAADWRSPEADRIGAANILVFDDGLMRAFNSDYLGVKLLLERKMPGERVAVVGYGGAGRAAAAAAEDCGRSLTIVRHNELGGGIDADVIIYTLPCRVEGCGKLDAGIILEANYRNPGLKAVPGYIGGKEWLLAQAETGYELMTGKKPDTEAMQKLPELSPN